MKILPFKRTVPHLICVCVFIPGNSFNLRSMDIFRLSSVSWQIPIATPSQSTPPTGKEIDSPPSPHFDLNWNENRERDCLPYFATLIFANIFSTGFPIYL